MTKPKPAMKQQKGFAIMTPEKRSQIASMGGKAAHDKGVAHKWTSEQAKAASAKSHASPKRALKFA